MFSCFFSKHMFSSKRTGWGMSELALLADPTKLERRRHRSHRDLASPVTSATVAAYVQTFQHVTWILDANSIRVFYMFLFIIVMLKDSALAILVAGFIRDCMGELDAVCRAFPSSTPGCWMVVGVWDDLAREVACTGRRHASRNSTSGPETSPMAAAPEIRLTANVHRTEPLQRTTRQGTQIIVTQGVILDCRA